MTISLIVAASLNNAIGKNNDLLWKLPNDMKHFKNVTWAMPIIMGRKTFDSMAGKPLNGRLNIVITRQQDWKAEGAVKVDSLYKALEIVQQNNYKEVFIIGGGEIYKAALSIADRVYLTRVEAEIEGDTFFPELNSTNWQLIEDNPHPSDVKHAYSYRFQVWQKKG
ncbi:MAG: dihydrofolate reductase [Sphingobacteriia bacterium]|nr:MAG: dihydrofolate reductase [Sphingobacteriia bacterium]